MTTTFRNAIFQVHWFLGITAGIVLALVGVTGAILSYEHEIVDALNPDVTTVEPAGRQALSPSELVARVNEQRPGTQVAAIELAADPRKTALVSFAPAPGERRGERRHLDPYTGQVLDELQHQGFFRTSMQLHRWLAMDDVGKQIVGASTVILIFFCLSGLYLRWPRRWGSLRTWLGLDWKQKGRNFLWHLHSVVGTWVLLAYLVMSLTGLWWSYGWYREAVNDWAAAGAPPRAEPAMPADRGAPPVFAIDSAWQAFNQHAPDWSTASIGVPKDDDSVVSVRYLDADPAHERARNTLALDRWTLSPVEHVRYDDGSLRQRIGGSMFALHRGSYFGTPGVVLFMLASLLMPLFAITGWMLYLDRRGKKRAKLAAAGALAAMPDARPIAANDPLLVAYASQTGTAERLALQTAATLREAGCAVEVRPLGPMEPGELAGRRVLFVASTYGEGEPPDPARGFARKLRDPTLSLEGLRYGVLALGDHDYGESFCGFGRELDQRLHHARATPLFDRIEVDDGDAAALRHWQHRLGQLSGRTDAPDWRAPDYRPWRLVDRKLMNAGSAGGAVFHVAMAPDDPADLRWQAGDIAEIGPRNAPAQVSAWLAAARLDGEAQVAVGDAREPLADVLSRSQLPPTDGHASAQAVAGALQPLPHREYSIASMPGDGTLQLLLRQMWRPDGQQGIGSGWLTSSATIGGPIALRVRSNPGFHPPGDDRPLLLVGNGTGIAGLRALLKSRIERGLHRNWLLFGERSSAHDFHYGDEFAAWHAAGQLERMDLAFSREQRGVAGGRRYVQDLLRMHAADIRAWLDAGAAVYVCGSLEGMAPGVEAALAGIVGMDTLERMAGEGRYRRDVY